MTRVRCISRTVNGLMHVALPHLFLAPFADGEEREIDDAAADILLGRVPGHAGSPCFEEVKPKLSAKPKADALTDGGHS